MQPVLYLDIDDTLLSWASGSPRGLPGSGAFVRWAMERFEVRWLTRWCPSGEMPDHLLADLSKMIGIDTSILGTIPACQWESGTKADGIAWLEHVALGREFAWVEDPEGLSERDHAVLGLTGFDHRYIACNVSEEDEDGLEQVRERLERLFPAARAA